MWVREVVSHHGRPRFAKAFATGLAILPLALGGAVGECSGASSVPVSIGPVLTPTGATHIIDGSHALTSTGPVERYADDKNFTLSRLTMSGASTTASYVVEGTPAQRKAVRAAALAACALKGRTFLTPTTCTVNPSVRIGTAHSSLAHGAQISGWAFAEGTFACDDGCYFAAVMRQQSGRPLRYEVVSFFGPTGGIG